MDSNHDKVIQSHLCYRYTTRQYKLLVLNMLQGNKTSPNFGYLLKMERGIGGFKIFFALTARLRGHPFDRACRRYGIEHRLTKPNHPWTNGQVERMNRTIKVATVRTYHYDGHAQLREHLASFLDAYNFAKRLKTLAGLTPYQFICSSFQKQPNFFTSNPLHLSPGLNS